MCGIIGGNLFTNRKQLFDAQELIYHRGVDHIGFFQNEGFWLGHNRLAIQDLSEKANQPFFDNDGLFGIVFNGELWNNTFKLYNDLLRKKYDFITEKSDTELFLYGFMEYGTDVFELFDGMFSVAIYDLVNKKVYMARDWVGRMPYYYLYKNGGLAFASEKKCLTETFESWASDVKHIEPSHYYVYNMIDGSLDQKRYFDIAKSCRDSDTELYKVQHEIYTSLHRSVKNELIADVPVCTILSGGIDSVIITYLLKKHVKDLKAYVVNVGKSTGKDDLHYARIAAKWLDIPLEEVIITKTQANKMLKESIWASEMDSWTQITPSVAQLFLADKISKDGYKVVFGGEGADELFGSYGNIQKMYYKQDTNKNARIGLIKNLHKNNIIRTNTSMMYGGTIELRTPFLDRQFAQYALGVVTIDAKHHKHPNGFVDINWENKSHMKFPLRKAFEHLVHEGMPEELLWRKKETFQVGCHTDYLRDEKEKITRMYRRLFHLPTKKGQKIKKVKSNILLKDKKDLANYERFIDFPVHVLGAMEKPTFDLDDIEILSTKFSKVGKTTLEKYKNLKTVIIRGHGEDLINRKLCEEKGIKIIKLNQYTESCAQWIVDKITGNNVYIYGVNGSIGKVVKTKLEKQNIKVWDSLCPKIDTVIGCISYDNFHHKNNEKFFCKELFSRFDTPVDFISISRSKTYHNQDLLDLMVEGKILNFHVDTIGSEHRKDLLGLQNFHYYEHTAWDYIKADENKLYEMLLKHIVRESSQWK